jgi:hypothetical protein
MKKVTLTLALMIGLSFASNASVSYIGKATKTYESANYIIFKCIAAGQLCCTVFDDGSALAFFDNVATPINNPTYDPINDEWTAELP